MAELETGGDLEEKDAAENLEDDPATKKKSPSGASGKKSSLRKWISLVILIILVPIALGLALRTGLYLYDGLLKKQSAGTPSEKVTNNNLFEETVSPFFIPMSTDSSDEVLKIDLSMIWDGITSVRFQRMKVKV